MYCSGVRIEEVGVLVGRQHDHEAACPLAGACSDAHAGVELG